ncbi:glycosyltransferase family 39 protein [Candidatus Babeliales bacterium]|nr:glycosyltransferase family 39 protein [Candidatus Babeliales bacterium]
MNSLDKVLVYLERMPWWTILRYVCVIWSLCILAFAPFRQFTVDEFEAIHSAYHIFKGHEVYLDFFQHHHPFLYYLVQPVFWMCGCSTNLIFALRYLMIGIFFLTCWGTYKLSLLLYDGKRALLSVILLQTSQMFMSTVIEIRPDTPQIACSIWALYFIFSYISKSHKLLDLCIGSFLLGCSFLFLQKAVFLISWMGILFIWMIIQRKIRVKDVVWAFLYGFTPIVLYALYLIWKGCWLRYIDLCWLLNAAMSYVAPWKTYLQALRENTLHWFYYFFFLIFGKKNQVIWYATYISCVLAAILLYTPCSFPQYFGIAMPFVSILAAAGLYEIFSYRAFVMAFVVLFTCANPMYSIYRAFRCSSDSDIARVEYIHSLTNDSDCVLDDTICGNLFRDDAFYWWFFSNGMRVYQTMRDYPFDAMAVIIAKRPKVVIPFGWKDVIYRDEFNKMYEQSPIYKEMYLLKERV